MGKVPTLAIIAAALVLIVGISVASFYLLIKPKKEELGTLSAKLEEEKQVVAQRPTAEAEQAATNARWMKAQADLAALRERKSIPISLYMPLFAMTSIWYEYRDDLPRAVETYLESQGVTIESGASIPAPPLAPPTVPSSGFMQVPGNAPLNLTVRGTLAQIQRVYENLAQLPRVATIGALNLTGTGQDLTASFPLSLYILVEGAEAVAPPPPAAGAGPEAGPGAPPDGPGGGPPPGPDGGGGEEEGGGGGGEDGGGGGGDE